MSGLCAGHVQLWGVSDRIIWAAGGKARSRALCVRGGGGGRLEHSAQMLSPHGGAFPFLASLPLMEHLGGLGYPKK